MSCSSRAIFLPCSLLSHRQIDRFTDGDNYILDKKCLETLNKYDSRSCDLPLEVLIAATIWWVRESKTKYSPGMSEANRLKRRHAVSKSQESRLVRRLAVRVVRKFGEMWARKENINRIPGSKHDGSSVYVLYDGSVPVYIGKGNIKSHIREARWSKTEPNSGTISVGIFWMTQGTSEVHLVVVNTRSRRKMNGDEDHSTCA
jgi:hypothetical protein